MPKAGDAVKIVLAVALVGAIGFLLWRFNLSTEAKFAVKEEMLDPGAAEFRNIETALITEDGAKIVCGEVNGKNRYGAYVGFQRFVYREKTGEAILQDRPAFQQFWRRYCD